MFKAAVPFQFIQSSTTTMTSNHIICSSYLRLSCILLSGPSWYSGKTLICELFCRQRKQNISRFSLKQKGFDTSSREKITSLCEELVYYVYHSALKSAQFIRIYLKWSQKIFPHKMFFTKFLWKLFWGLNAGEKIANKRTNRISKS